MNWKELIDEKFKNPLYLCQVKEVKRDILINNHKINFASCRLPNFYISIYIVNVNLFQAKVIQQFKTVFI